jgi:hypothetical protein
MVSKTFLTAIGLLLIAAFLYGCADVPSTGPTPPDPRSLARFVNADPGLGNVAVSVANPTGGTSTVGSVAYQAGTSYGEFAAGSYKVTLNPGSAADTGRVTFTTDRKATIFILPQSGGVREYFKANERYLYNPAGVANSALLRAINLVAFLDAEGNEVGADATFLGPDTLVAEAGLQKDATPYVEMRPGNYTVTVYLAGTDSVLTTGALSVAANKRYTSVLMGTPTAPVIVNLTDD